MLLRSWFLVVFKSQWPRLGQHPSLCPEAPLVLHEPLLVTRPSRAAAAPFEAIDRPRDVPFVVGTDLASSVLATAMRWETLRSAERAWCEGGDVARERGRGAE